MKKQIITIITIFITGILIGCGMMYAILNPSIKVCPEIKKCPDCPKQETEKIEDNCIEQAPLPSTPEEPEANEKALEIDDIVKDVTLNPTEEDVYTLLSASNSSMSVSEDLLGIMYSEKDLSDFISLYVIEYLFDIATDLDYDKVVMNNDSKLSIKRTTLEKLGKKLYANYHTPTTKIEGYYEGISNIECDEATCVFDWEIWGYVGPGESHYRSNTISEKKSGKNTVITIEILYEEIEVIDNEEEVLESSTIRKRHDSTEKKDIGVQYENHNFDYYKKHLSSTEKYQYTFDQNNTLISIKRVN